MDNTTQTIAAVARAKGVSVSLLYTWKRTRKPTAQREFEKEITAPSLPVATPENPVTWNGQSYVISSQGLQLLCDGKLGRILPWTLLRDLSDIISGSDF